MSAQTSTAGRNPYSDGTPEWQLWENMTSALALQVSHAADAERSQKKSADARERAERFKHALDTLAAAKTGGAS